MRPRNKKHLEERYEKCIYLTVPDPCDLKGKWRTLFNRDGAPLYLEIGCGKGAFVTGMAAKHPEADFIAVECVKNVLVTALEKTAASGLENIRFIHTNAEILTDIFAPGEIDTIYLNFSDPWPRKKQAKHRLTHPSFLVSYGTILSESGRVVQKTDNPDLFEYSVESFTENGWRLANVSYDLHGADTPPEISEENVITEYEKRFMESGIPIKRLEAYPPGR